MRVATVDGLVTLFYDGSKELYNDELDPEWYLEYDEYDQNHDNWESWDLSNECKKYRRERLSWQQIIVVEGVTEIPEKTFRRCHNIKRVIMTNTVIRIARKAFYGCTSLTSIFIPPSCREIAMNAFYCCEKLIIFHVPLHVELGEGVIGSTALVNHAPFKVDVDGWYSHTVKDNMNTWIKNMNRDMAFSLHRACASFQPLKQVLFNIVEEKGLNAFREVNSIGITPSQYLKDNPYTALTEKEIIHDYLMKLIG